MQIYLTFHTAEPPSPEATVSADGYARVHGEPKTWQDDNALRYAATAQRTAQDFYSMARTESDPEECAFYQRCAANASLNARYWLFGEGVSDAADS